MTYYLISYLDGWHNHRMVITSYHPIEWVVRECSKSKSPLVSKLVVLNVYEFSSEQYDEIVSNLRKDGLSDALIKLDGA